MREQSTKHWGPNDILELFQYTTRKPQFDIKITIWSQYNCRYKMGTEEIHLPFNYLAVPKASFGHICACRRRLRAPPANIPSD